MTRLRQPHVLLGTMVSMFATCATACPSFDAVTASTIPRAECSTYLTTDVTPGRTCFWSFPLRSSQAIEWANDLWRKVQSCGEGTIQAPDQQVNHPDSYDLRRWRTDSGTFYISVKDKGALNQTLVFLRWEKGG